VRRHRTTARGIAFLLLAAAGLAGVAGAATPPRGLVDGKPIVFPLVGKALLTGSWGDPRGQGRHAGEDIMAPRRAPVLAAEPGRVKWWTTSALAGCMLYLYGESGTTYLYIHLNNDLTAKRDNKGKCVPGVAYMDGLKNGARVKAGQQIAYNGDSGDAEGIYHLHFEVHPKDGAATDPFPYLNAATKLLFPLPVKPASAVTLGLRGMPLSAGAGVLELSVTGVRVWPGGAWISVPARSVELAVPPDALLDRSVAAQIVAPTRRALSSRAVVPLVVITRPAKPTLDVTMGSPGTLSVDHIQLG
jgi:hypothetical protein